MLSGCKPVSFSILSLQIKIIALEKQVVILEDLGIIDYKTAWDYQESLLNRNLEVKMQARKKEIKVSDAVIDSENFTVQSLESNIDTSGKLVFCKKLLKEGFIKISNNGS